MQVFRTSVLFMSALGAAAAQSPAVDYFDMSIEELMNIPVFSVSRQDEEAGRAAGVVLVVTSEEWQRYGANTISDVIRRLPAAQPMSGAGLRDNLTDIRGQHSVAQDRRTMMLLNGRPVREAFFGGLNRHIYVGMPLTMVERIEYIRGPAAVMYGSNAMSGAINIITKTGSEEWLSQVELSLGSYSAHKATVMASGSIDALGFSTVLQRHDSEGYPTAGYDYSPPSSGGPYYSQADMDDHDASAFVDLSAYDFRLQYFEVNSDQAFLGPQPFAPVDSGRRKQSFLDLGYLLALDNAQLGANYTSARMRKDDNYYAFFCRISTPVSKAAWTRWNCSAITVTTSYCLCSSALNATDSAAVPI